MLPVPIIPKIMLAHGILGAGLAATASELAILPLEGLYSSELHRTVTNHLPDRSQQ